MHIQQLIGGVGGDTSAQAVQLRMRLAGQNQLAGQARLVAHDATGSNPVVITTFPPPNPASGGCLDILIASAAFADATSPSVASDYVMDNLIPASYLPAGSLTFETASGSTIYWRVSWGGAGYTGSTSGSPTNDDDGDFGPPFAGPLPSDTDQALAYQPSCPTASSSNADDYAVTSGPAVFTNNAGDDATVVAEPPDEQPVPTVSEWGMLMFCLALLTAATITFGRARHRAAAE